AAFQNRTQLLIYLFASLLLSLTILYANKIPKIALITAKTISFLLKQIIAITAHKITIPILKIL
ncbi:MAG: hypothetical protein E7H98_08300, partial [Finegoldia magna]|nr:hypothetical protein [Finegoldia magna]